MFVTETRDKKVYMVNASTDWENPRLIVGYWLTSADSDVIPDGTRLEKWNGVYLAYLYGKQIPVYPVNDYPEFTEFIPIKPPRKTGYIWRYGEWVKK